MPPPRKKRPPAGSLSPVREQFSPTGTLCGGQVGLPGKSCPDEGAKTAPGGSRELCAGCAHGGRAGNGGWCRESTALGARRGRGHTRRKNSPGGGRELCAGRAHGGTAGIVCRVVSGKHRTGHPPGQRACPGAKTAPGGAGGCLDAGYGCYLPRAIRVIWMHRVGSTARPRIMPS